MGTHDCRGSLQWRQNEHDGVSNHWSLDCLPNCLSRPRSKKISKLCVTGLCEGNSPVTGELPAQRASNAENVSIWWCHHVQCSQVPGSWTEQLRCWTHWGLVTHIYVCVCIYIYMCVCVYQWTGSSLVQVMACCLCGAAPCHYLN